MPAESAALAELIERYPTAPRGEPVELFTETAHVNGVAIELVGLSTEYEGECIVGSAASLSETPLFRAYMELCERLAILAAIGSSEERLIVMDDSGRRMGFAPRAHVFPENPDRDRWRWARSNGVAAGANWKDAAERARFELVERDRVLRSWYGEITPRRVDLPEAVVPAALHEIYDFRAYLFDAETERGNAVAGLFGFPKNDEPLLFGFGSRDAPGSAIGAAASECLQRLGFLWGEPLPDAPPVPAPTPDFHQEHYLFPAHHGPIRSWLDGEHSGHRGLLGVPRETGEIRFVDVTPASLRGRIAVAKALPSGHVPLAFGAMSPLVKGALPTGLAVHPIA